MQREADSGKEVETGKEEKTSGNSHDSLEEAEDLNATMNETPESRPRKVNLNFVLVRLWMRNGHETGSPD